MNRNRMLLSALLMEAVLALAALILARLILGRVFPWPMFIHGWGLLLGTLAAIPPAAVVSTMWLPPFTGIAVVRRVRDRMLQRLAPLARPLMQARWYDLLVVACCAGVGEELFFRGLLQSAIGILPAALVFGLFHALTISYFLFATAMGLYFSLLYISSGNLVVAILAHIVYDIFALYLLRGTLHPHDG